MVYKLTMPSTFICKCIRNGYWKFIPDWNQTESVDTPCRREHGKFIPENTYEFVFLFVFKFII